MQLLLRIALTAWVTAAWVEPAGAEPQVAFVNLEASPAGVASLRARAVEAGRLCLPRGPLRDALEDEPDPGADLVARAAEALAAAKEAYTRFAFDAANERLDRALAHILDAQAGDGRAELLARHHFLRGLVREGQGDLDGARGSFRMVVRLEPRRTTLDSGLYRPDLVALFEEVASAEIRKESERLEIRSEPAGATVEVDGRRVGRAPIEVSLTPGGHYVTLSHPSHRVRLELVKVRPGGGSYSARLEPVTPAERARELRRQIARADSQSARRRAAAALAELVGVELLVLVRRAPSGAGLEASIYRPGPRADLGPWRRAPSASFFASLDASPQREARPRPLVEEAPEKPGARPWYQSWWGVSLLAGGTAVVVGAAVLSLDGGSSSYRVSDFCFEGACQ